MPCVTALRGVGRGRVAVELDGAAWRTVPLEAAVCAGLSVGIELDRPALRTLRRELRRLEALSVAVGALRYRDHSKASLEQRLERRGVAPSQREQTLGMLTRAGIVDDQRFAHDRAAALASRGGGDLLIADDLGRHGMTAEMIEAALGLLEPESERAQRVVERRGASPKTWRFLAAKGFAAETIESLVADAGDGAIA